MVHIRPSHTHSQHLSICCTMAPRLVSWHRKISVSSMCSQEVTACFMLALVTNCLPAWCFLRGPKRQKSLYVRLQLYWRQNKNPQPLCSSKSQVTNLVSSMRPSNFHLLWMPSDALEWQVFCNRCQCEASCHLDTWQWILLHHNTSLGYVVEQMLKCRW
jgi:hypothetical protein